MAITTKHVHLNQAHSCFVHACISITRLLCTCLGAAVTGGDRQDSMGCFTRSFPPLKGSGWTVTSVVKGVSHARYLTWAIVGVSDMYSTLKLDGYALLLHSSSISALRETSIMNTPTTMSSSWYLGQDQGDDGYPGIEMSSLSNPAQNAQTPGCDTDSPGVPDTTTGGEYGTSQQQSSDLLSTTTGNYVESTYNRVFSGSPVSNLSAENVSASRRGSELNDRTTYGYPPVSPVSPSAQTSTPTYRPGASIANDYLQISPLYPSTQSAR
jgi:hypothetical protein